MRFFQQLSPSVMLFASTVNNIIWMFRDKWALYVWDTDYYVCLSKVCLLTCYIGNVVASVAAVTRQWASRRRYANDEWSYTTNRFEAKWNCVTVGWGERPRVLRQVGADAVAKFAWPRLCNWRTGRPLSVISSIAQYSTLRAEGRWALLFLSYTTVAASHPIIIVT